MFTWQDDPNVPDWIIGVGRENLQQDSVCLVRFHINHEATGLFLDDTGGKFKAQLTLTLIEDEVTPGGGVGVIALHEGGHDQVGWSNTQ